jgi:hypothetical protein
MHGSLDLHWERPVNVLKHDPLIALAVEGPASPALPRNLRATTGGSTP